ncbi:MAG: AAA family ATPase [Gemmatimonadetes bacterium]|nr:AAA family ATPase [Gemmatimonadota bacterium]
MRSGGESEIASLTQTLIGRDKDLAVLFPYLDSAAAGSGGTIVLMGAGGVGKTRLAEAVADEAHRRKFRVATGRAFRVETGVPYALFSDAFIPVIRDLDPASRATLTRGAESELSVVLPALGAARPQASRPQGDDPAEMRTRLLWTVAEFVRSLSARQPLLLLLDDVHWADLSSLELLHFLARQTAQSRVLIVCTYNATERELRPELRSMEQSLLSLGVAHVHTVEPLTRAATGQLISQLFGPADDIIHEFASLLYGWTRGNVFFLRETLQSLVDSGRLHRRDDGHWMGWESAELELPGSIREALTARFGRLSAAARSVADTAAVIGTRFNHEVLRSVAHVRDDDLLEAIDELRRLHIVAETVTAGELRYDFVHPLLRQVLYGELGTARCRLIHGAVAEDLEYRYRGDTAAHADELAFHYARAGADALAPKALQYLHAAGRHAFDRFADREALDYLRLARDRWTPDSTVPRNALTADLARVLQRLGDYDAAIVLWREMLTPDVSPPTASPTGTGATSTSANTAAIHRRLGQAHYWSGRFADALDHYRTGIDLVQDTGGADEAALRLAAGVCLQELGRAAEAGREIEGARVIAEKVGDTGLLARTHRSLLLLRIWTGPPDEARLHGARAAQLARDSSDASNEFYSEWGLAVLEGLTGHTEAMARHLAVTERIAERQRSPLLRLWTAELSIELAAALGEWERGIAIGEHAIAMARSLNQRTMLPRLLVWTSLIHLHRDDVDIAKAYIDEAWQSSHAGAADSGPVDVHTVVPAHIGRAAYHVVTRDFAEAIRVCHRGLAIADRTGYTFWAMHRLLPLLAEAHCHLWDVEGALVVERRIRLEAERLGHKSGLAWADSCRALAVWLGGDPAGATRLIREACESLEAIPMLGDAARLRRQLAGRLAETGDRDGALKELRRVYDMLASMGAEQELTKARKMFREIDAKPPARTAATGIDGLTDREIEIARMVADRKSNKAIAKALDIAPRTVSTHVSNIFRKLEVENRGALADYVRDRGVG